MKTRSNGEIHKSEITIGMTVFSVYSCYGHTVAEWNIENKNDLKELRSTRETYYRTREIAEEHRIACYNQEIEYQKGTIKGALKEIKRINAVIIC